jgi:hypothetical protein
VARILRGTMRSKTRTAARDLSRPRHGLSMSVTQMGHRPSRNRLPLWMRRGPNTACYTCEVNRRHSGLVPEDHPRMVCLREDKAVTEGHRVSGHALVRAGPNRGAEEEPCRDRTRGRQRSDRVRAFAVRAGWHHERYPWAGGTWRRKSRTARSPRTSALDSKSLLTKSE